MQDTYGRVSLPDNFIAAAERYGHMPDIDCWVTARGLKWLEDAPGSVFLNINLSGQTIASSEGLNRLTNLLEGHPDVLNRLCFEITEGAALVNNSRARNFITRIRDKGCQVALDDYGSGVFSVSYLRKLPVDVLKIDGELVKTAAKDAVALAMVESIARMASALGIVTVAEHIEDEAVMLKIQSLGIDYGQGYLFGKPARLDAFVESDAETSNLRQAFVRPTDSDEN
jgi:EAL domain-containing protein (putative c-di-GMP-specific phosphodiesterase class I)